MIDARDLVIHSRECIHMVKGVSGRDGRRRVVPGEAPLAL